MDLDALDLFVSVAKAGSYAAVARDRQIDPSSISRMMTALERDLGVRLFQRTTRQIALTDSGAVFHARILPLVEEIRLARLAALDASSQPRGVLRVTASNSFGLTCVVPMLPRFCEDYPELTVDLQLTDQVVDLIAERIDVAIRLGVLQDSGLVAQSLMPVRYVVCASDAYLLRAGRPREPADIARHPCILFPLPGFRTRWIFKDAIGATEEVAVSGPAILSNALAIQHCAVRRHGDRAVAVLAGRGGPIRGAPDQPVPRPRRDGDRFQHRRLVRLPDAHLCADQGQGLHRPSAPKPGLSAIPSQDQAGPPLSRRQLLLPQPVVDTMRD